MRMHKMLCQLKRSLPEHNLLNIHQGGNLAIDFGGWKKKRHIFGMKKSIATKINKLRKLVAMDNISNYRFIFAFFEEIVYNIS